MKELSLERKQEIGKTFCKMSNEERTLEICEIAVEQNGINIQFVPNCFLSTELAIKAIEQDMATFFFLKRAQINSETLKTCFKKAKEVNADYPYFGLILNKLNQFYNLNMKDLINKDVALELVSWHGDLIHWIPYHLRRDADVIKTAVMNCGDAISKLEEEDVTKELVLLAIKGNIQVNRIPKQFVTEEILTKMVEYDWTHIKDIPKGYQTAEVCMTALRQNESAVQYLDL